MTTCRLARPRIAKATIVGTCEFGCGGAGSASSIRSRSRNHLYCFVFLFAGDNFLPLHRDYDNAAITLERAPCYGTCPVYSLTIFGNGTVVYEGRYHVVVVGKQTSEISREKVKELINYMHKSGFFSMENYGACCDAPKYTTSITMGSLSKTVIYNYYSAPSRLVDLDKKIDSIAGSDKLVRLTG